MESIGAEVGQKMRSAIKAKLLELNCYVDDELPDYIMVMVANKRTKSQMIEDLNLFLSNKTATFVNWLHIVLKKLKEVTVTNPEVYKNVVKRKVVEDDAVKEEKKLKKLKQEEECQPSLTDNLPISAIGLNQKKRVNLITHEHFDIPLLSEVNSSTMQELQELEKRISNVKSRLGDMVEDEESSVEYGVTDQKNSGSYRTVKLQEDPEISEILLESQHSNQVFVESIQSKQYNIIQTNDSLEETISPKKKHSPIVFENTPNKKRISALHRLGEKSNSLREKNKTVSSELRKGKEVLVDCSEEERKRPECRIQIGKLSRHSRTGISNRNRKSVDQSEHVQWSKSDVPVKNIKMLNKLGVLSKIHIPQKDLDGKLHELPKVEVKSVVQVKPRVIPADIIQPSKNLLLKAVAEAQKSIVQASRPKISRLIESDAEIKSSESESKRTLLRSEKSKLRNIILSNISHEKTEVHDIVTDENNPKPTKDFNTDDKSILSEAEEKQFIVTFDACNKQTDIPNVVEEGLAIRSPVRLRLQQRKSPIYFDNTTKMVKPIRNISNKLPTIRSAPSIKKAERCKYWPTCRQGVMCEFGHPDVDCENFPNCSFGDKCLYIHPTCKFASSCTKRNCPFSHVALQKSIDLGSLKHGVKKTFSTKLQTCKYFPNCIKIDCPFYHPKPCKYGRYCRNPIECTFTHPADIVNPHFTWRSK